MGRREGGRCRAGGGKLAAGAWQRGAGGSKELEWRSGLAPAEQRPLFRQLRCGGAELRVGSGGGDPSLPLAQWRREQHTPLLHPRPLLDWQKEEAGNSSGGAGGAAAAGACAEGTHAVRAGPAVTSARPDTWPSGHAARAMTANCKSAAFGGD